MPEGVSRACDGRSLAAPEPGAADTARREHSQRAAPDCPCYGSRRVTKEPHRRNRTGGASPPTMGAYCA